MVLCLISIFATAQAQVRQFGLERKRIKALASEGGGPESGNSAGGTLLFAAVEDSGVFMATASTRGPDWTPVGFQFSSHRDVSALCVQHVGTPRGDSLHVYAGIRHIDARRRVSGTSIACALGSQSVAERSLASQTKHAFERQRRLKACVVSRRGWDSNPRYGSPYTHFPGVPVQPLLHLSGDGPRDNAGPETVSNNTVFAEKRKPCMDRIAGRGARATLRHAPLIQEPLKSDERILDALHISQLRGGVGDGVILQLQQTRLLFLIEFFDAGFDVLGQHELQEFPLARTERSSPFPR